jgi:hypothetical protein
MTAAEKNTTRPEAGWDDAVGSVNPIATGLPALDSSYRVKAIRIAAHPSNVQAAPSNAAEPIRFVEQLASTGDTREC